MDYLNSERDDPNILDMDFSKYHFMKLLLDDSSIREKFLGVLPKEIFSTDKYRLMDIESCKVNMSPGKWLLEYLGNCGGRVSDLIYWFQEINLERALIYLKDEEPLQIIEQPEPNITVNEGEKFLIKCRATGYPHPEYQWFKDGEELLLEGCEQALTVPFAKVEDSGIYMCKISKINADSSISTLSSKFATEEVLPCKSSNSVGFLRQNSDKTQPSSIKPDLKIIQTNPKELYEQNILSAKCPESEKITIKKQPRSYDEVAQGSYLCFKCVAKAAHPVNYQWSKNGRILDGQTSTMLLIHELFPEEGKREFQFLCRVYNEYDEVTSDVALVKLSQSNDKTKYVAEEKIAFLVANDKYEAYEEDLVTPAFDVVDLAKLLKSIDFKVIVFRNLNLREMQSAFQAFCRMLREGSYAVVFFAGHGFECYGQTYLQPIDCSENLLPEESVCTEYMLQQMQKTKTALNVLLIDACRKRPPELGPAQIELYDVSVGSNTVYGYATSFLNGAYETAERNSFFVKHLKKYIAQDRTIQEIIFQVQMDFDAEPLTRNIQHPVLESSLCAARKLCDELRNPLDNTFQLPSCLYQERNPIEKETKFIDKFKSSFVIEIKDHMDVFLNGIDVNLYIHVKEDANLDELRKSGLAVVLDIPALQLSKGALFKNAALKLGARNLIIKEEVFKLQRLKNNEIEAKLLLKIGKNLIIPIEFSFTVEKIKSMDTFF